MSGLQEAFEVVRRRPGFGRLWAGVMVSRVGDRFTVVALSWLVLGISGPGGLGLALMLFGLPSLVGGPVAGRLLDRYGARAVLALDNFGRAWLVVLIPVLRWFGVLEVWHVYLVAFGCGLLSPATETGENVLIPDLVADEDLEAANALVSANWEVASIAGPVTAGALVGAAGAPVALLVDAASFCAMGAVALSLPCARPEPAGTGGWSLRETLLGFGMLVKLRAVGIVTALGIGFLLVHGVQEVLPPVYSKEALGAGAAGYGVLMSAFGLGSLAGLLVAGPLAGRVRPAFGLGVTLAAGGLLFLPLALVDSLLAAAVSIALAGFASAPYYVVARAWIQCLTPGHLRGRVFGARTSLGAAGFPLGNVLGGVLLQPLGRLCHTPGLPGLSRVGRLGLGLPHPQRHR